MDWNNLLKQPTTVMGLALGAGAAVYAGAHALGVPDAASVAAGVASAVATAVGMPDHTADIEATVNDAVLAASEPTAAHLTKVVTDAVKDLQDASAATAAGATTTATTKGTST